MKIIALHILVTGKVQGLFYRKFTLNQARMNGVKGWVKNLPGGEVEITVEGTEANVMLFTEWCKKGPKNAVVTQLEQNEVAVVGFKDFRII